MATALSLFRTAMESKGWESDANDFGYTNYIGMAKDLTGTLSDAQKTYVAERNSHGGNWTLQVGCRVSVSDLESLVFSHNGQDMWRKDETEATGMHQAMQLRLNRLLQTAYEEACAEATATWNKYMKVPKGWDGWTTE